MTRRGRGIGPDDEALWHRVAGSARPLHPKARHPAPRPLTLHPHGPAGHAPKQVPQFQIGQSRSQVAMPSDIGYDLSPGPADRLARMPIRMDRKTHASMARGKLAPEARLDLHGMTLAEAHPALTGFVLRAHAAGFRLVLVITGKGKARDEPGPIPQRMGVLRQQVPLWLTQPPLGQAVMQIAQAHQRHGGAGAYYVYLRRPR